MQSLAKRVSLVTDSPDCYVSQENPSEIDKGLRNKFELYFHKTEPQGSTPGICPPSRPIRPLSGTKTTGWLPLPS